MERPWGKTGFGWLFALGALVCGLAVTFSIALGTIPLVGVGLILLALALLVG